MKYYAMSHIPRTDHITALSDWPATEKYSCLADVTSEANHLLKKRSNSHLLFLFNASVKNTGFA